MPFPHLFDQILLYSFATGVLREILNLVWIFLKIVKLIEIKPVEYVLVSVIPDDPLDVVVICAVVLSEETRLRQRR